MSFDILYQPCRFGAEPVEQKNPFTGQVQTVLPVKPLSDDDLRVVQEVLEKAGAVVPDEFGCYVVQLGDGGAAEVHAGHLETGCMVALHGGLTRDLLQFLFDLLRSADWIMLPAMEGNPAISALPGRAESFADSFPEVVCRSAVELGAVLSGGSEEWERYRIQLS
jgi:hypothetical protein